MSSQRVPGGVVHKLPADLRKALIANEGAEAAADLDQMPVALSPRSSGCPSGSVQLREAPEPDGVAAEIAEAPGAAGLLGADR
jgi:hypothetical protein